MADDEQQNLIQVAFEAPASEQMKPKRPKESDLSDKGKRYKRKMDRRVFASKINTPINREIHHI